jgi:probable addiction module antidote protein
MSLKTHRFDAAAVLDTPEAIEAFLEDAFESGDAAFITHALGIVARAKGMSQLAEETGLSRQALYKALSAEGRPEFGTVLKVAGALGFWLQPQRVSEAG